MGDTEKKIVELTSDTEAWIESYMNKFCNSLLVYKLEISNVGSENLLEKILDSIDHLLLKKEDFLVFLMTFVKNDYCNGALLSGFFQKLLQFYEDNGIELTTDYKLNSLINDNFRFFNYDLFLSVCTVLIQNSKYEVLAEIVKTNYRVYKEDGDYEDYRFTSFREYNYTLNEIKRNIYKLDSKSVVARIVKDSSNYIRFEDIINTDILLYYMSLVYPGKTWMPETACYFNGNWFNNQFRTREYFTNTKILFDVKSLRGLRKKLNNINEPNIRDIDGYDQIPLIKDSFMMRIFS